MDRINSKVAFVLDEEMALDARCQKEVASIKKMGADVLFCGWNKGLDGQDYELEETVRGKRIKSHYICSKVKRRAGLKDNFLALCRYQSRLYKWLCKNKKNIDIVHSCNLDSSFIVSIFCRIHKKVHIYDIYDDYADCHMSNGIIYKIIKFIDAGVIKHADRVIICSERRKEQLAYKTKRLSIIHNTPDIDHIDDQKSRVQRSNITKLVIIYAGLLVERRMVLELIQIAQRHKEWDLFIGGAGSLEEEVVRMSNGYENIHFLGRLEYEEVLASEADSDVIPALYDPSFPNHKYAAPNKFYESLFAGKPTIMVHDTGLDDIVDKYKTGITIDFNQYELEKALQDIENNLLFWRSRDSYLKNLHQEKYSWERMEQELQKIYSKYDRKTNC